jgi:hypothetical protein
MTSDLPDPAPTDQAPTDQAQDYAAEAELFAVQKLGRKRNLFYRRFDTAAEAIKFAIEEMTDSTSNLVLETEFSRLDAAGIAALYAADSFPLERRSSPAASP